MSGRDGKRRAGPRRSPRPSRRGPHQREAAEAEETALVLAARESGHTWSEIGALYGLTKQGAQQRFRPVRDQVDKAKAAS